MKFKFYSKTTTEIVWKHHQLRYIFFLLSENNAHFVPKGSQVAVNKQMIESLHFLSITAFASKINPKPFFTLSSKGNAL